MTDYLELHAAGYFLLYLVRLFLNSGIIKAFAWVSASLILLTIAAFLSLIIMPRIVEDYVKLKNWYINSDFCRIFDEKVDTGITFKLIGLPFALFFSFLFLILDLITATAYSLAAKLGFLYCVGCNSYMEWKDEQKKCRYCGEEFSSYPDKTCPACNFKPNALRCPYCGYVVLISLHGKHPSSRFRQEKNDG
ncbi:MAG: hypothetical protein HQM10_04730 [Candidatus Riflebacteria bacterium]|nr:hypothetical protein [Candidatus Riflebacteria bacterium]